MRALPSAIIPIIFLAITTGGTDLPKTRASDYELHDRVRQCTERTTYPSSNYVGERTITTTSEFSVEGWLLEQRVAASTGTDYVTTYTYDTAGRLLKISAGNEAQSGTTKFDTIYVYDAEGQLISVNSASGAQQMDYEYGKDGPKRVTEHFPERSAERNVGVGAITWEGSDLPFPPPSGGTITTIYDEQNRPLEGQVRDASGNLAMRIIRTYDGQGNIEGDKLVPEEAQTVVPEELGSQLNEAQKKAMADFIASAFYTGESKYKYDSQGRVVEKQLIGGAVGSSTFTAIRYNDHGDISDEITLETRTANPGGEFKLDDAGKLFPVSTPQALEPKRIETHYAYEYDARGNWTRRTTTSGAANGEATTSATVERTLRYYPDR